MDLQFTLNESVKRIVSEIRLKEYAHFSTILQTFFELNGISGLADLGITNLPALDRLYAIDRKVSLFISSYLSMHEIISISELEIYLVQFLDAFIVPRDPPVQQAYVSSSRDPNAIDLDDECRDDLNINVHESFSFKSFGVGELKGHYLLRPLFPKPIVKQLSASVVRRYLRDFITDKSTCSIPFSTQSFGKYLSDSFSVSSTQELGIVFTGNLKHELLIIQHVNESALHQTSRIAEENSECYQKRQRSEITESNRSYLVENESILSRHSQTHIPVSHLPPESYLEKSKDFVPSDFNLSTVKICRTDCGEEIPFSEFSFCIPIFAEVEYTNADIGRWGESLVYQYLLYAHPNENITWINRESETRAFYDITIVSKRNKGLCCTRFVEVKTTRYCDRNVFQISPWEYDFLSSHPRPNYDIYRVYGAPGTSFVKPRLVIYKDIYTLIQEKKINLCLAV